MNIPRLYKGSQSRVNTEPAHGHVSITGELRVNPERELREAGGEHDGTLEIVN